MFDVFVVNSDISINIHYLLGIIWLIIVISAIKKLVLLNSFSRMDSCASTVIIHSIR